MKLRTSYSLWNLLNAARRGHADWAPAWIEAEPKPAYDVLIVGGGGHGLATAYYLAKNHGITNVAVLEAIPAATPPSYVPTTSTPKARGCTTSL
jgi:sarcosine oxidase subunit beta